MRPKNLTFLTCGGGRVGERVRIFRAGEGEAEGKMKNKEFRVGIEAYMTKKGFRAYTMKRFRVGQQK